MATARLLLKEHHLFACVNRLYYACLFAVSALLLKNGLRSSRHAGVQALFNKHYVRAGHVPKEMGTLLSTLFDARQESDYADMVEFDEAEVAQWLAEASGFVSTVERLVAGDSPPGGSSEACKA